MAIHRFEIFADYHQFYLEDDEADLSESVPSDVTDEDIRRKLKVKPHLVAIYPARNMTVPVTVEVLDAEPKRDWEAWDHVAECSLEVPSGRIVIMGCTDYRVEAERIAVAPGTYRVRVHYGRLDDLSADGLDGEDHYHVALWPAPAAELTVLKQHRRRTKPLAPEPILRAALATLGWACISAHQTSQAPDEIAMLIPGMPPEMARRRPNDVIQGILEAVQWIPTLLNAWPNDGLAKIREKLATLTPGGWPPSPDLAKFFEERLKDFDFRETP